MPARVAEVVEIGDSAGCHSHSPGRKWANICANLSASSSMVNAQPGSVVAITQPRSRRRQGPREIATVQEDRRSGNPSSNVVPSFRHSLHTARHQCVERLLTTSSMATLILEDRLTTTSCIERTHWDEMSPIPIVLYSRHFCVFLIAGLDETECCSLVEILRSGVLLRRSSIFNEPLMRSMPYLIAVRRRPVEVVDPY